MNAVLNLSRLPVSYLPIRSVIPPPPARISVELNPGGLTFLRRLIILDYQKHLFGLIDRYCDDFTSSEIRATCMLLSGESLSELTGLEHRYLLDYVSQRMQMICKYDCSLLAGVAQPVLFFALNTLRLQLERAAQAPHKAPLA